MFLEQIEKNKKSAFRHLVSIKKAMLELAYILLIAVLAVLGIVLSLHALQVPRYVINITLILFIMLNTVVSHTLFSDSDDLHHT